MILRVYAGKTIDLTVQPMLNAGSTPLPWEPYTGGKPSPSPDYPQEIESVGTKWSTGANLVDVHNAIKINAYGLEVTVKDDGTIVVSGTSSSNAKNLSFSFLDNKFSFPLTSIFKLFDVEEKNCKLSSVRRTNASDATNNKIAIDINQINSGNPIYCSFKLVVSERAVEEYEPYTGGVPKPYGDKIGVEVRGKNLLDPAQSMSIATPNGLPGIPVSSGGNYTDVDSRQWICDEIDFGRGMYVQNIKVSKSLNDLSWHTWGVNKGANGITGFYTYDIDIPKIGKAVSNIARYNEDIHGGKREGICASIIQTTSMTPYMILCVRNDTISDISSDNAAIQSFKEMLAETDAYMMYVLATQIETPLTADQLNAYKALRIYKGTTIIDNDAGAYMSVKYEKMK